MKSKININKINVVLGLCSALALSTLPVGVVYAEDTTSGTVDTDPVTGVETLQKTVTYSENGVVYTITETEVESETTNPDVDDDNNSGNDTDGDGNTDTDGNTGSDDDDTGIDPENDNNQTEPVKADVSKLKEYANISYKASDSDDDDGSIDNLVQGDTIVITFKRDDDLDGDNVSSREAFESDDLVVKAGDVTFSDSDSEYDDEKGSYTYKITKDDAKNGITFTATYKSSGSNSGGGSNSEQNDNIDLESVIISSDNEFVGATLTAKTTIGASDLGYQWLIWNDDSSEYVDVDSDGTSKTYTTSEAGIYAVEVTQDKESTEDGTADIVKYSSKDDTKGYVIKETTQTTTTYKLTLDSSIEIEGDDKDIKLSNDGSDVTFDDKKVATLNENTSITVTVLNQDVLDGDKSIYVNDDEMSLSDLNSDGDNNNFSIEMTSDTTLKIDDASSSNNENTDTVNLIFEGIGIEFSYVDSDGNETKLSEEEFSSIPSGVTLKGKITNDDIIEELNTNIISICLTQIETETKTEIETDIVLEGDVFNCIISNANDIKVEIKVESAKASIAELKKYATVEYVVKEEQEAQEAQEAQEVDEDDTQSGFNNIIEDDTIKITFKDKDKDAFESGDLVVKAGDDEIKYDVKDSNYSEGVYNYTITSDDVDNGIMFTVSYEDETTIAEGESILEDKTTTSEGESILEDKTTTSEGESILEDETTTPEGETILEENKTTVEDEEVSPVSLFMPTSDFSYSTAINAVNSFGQLPEVSFQEAQQVAEKTYKYTVKAELETGDNINSITNLVILDKLNLSELDKTLFNKFSGDASSAGSIEIDNSALHTSNKLTFRGTNVEKVTILTNEIIDLYLPNIKTSKLELYAVNIRNLSIPDTITNLTTSAHSQMILVTMLGDGSKVINSVSGDGSKINGTSNMLSIEAGGGTVDITYDTVETLNIVVEYKGIQYTIVLTATTEEILYGISVVSDEPTIDIDGVEYKLLKVNATLKDDLSNVDEIYIPSNLSDIDWEETSLSDETSYSLEDLSIFEDVSFNVSVSDLINNDNNFKIQATPNLTTVTINNQDITSIVIEGKLNENITIVAEPKSNINSIALINDIAEDGEETTIVNKFNIKNNTGAELSNVTVSIDDYYTILHNISNNDNIVVEPSQDISVKIDTEITGGSVIVKTNNDDIDSKVNIGDMLVLTAIADSKYAFTEWNVTYENYLGEIVIIQLENVISQTFEVTDKMNSISISAKFSSNSSGSNSSSSTSGSGGSGSLSNQNISLGTSSDFKINNNTTSTGTNSTDSTIVDKSITLKYKSTNSTEEKYEEVFKKYDDIDSHWGKNAIAFGISQGYLYGSSDSAFSANDNVTRDMMVQVLSKMSSDNISQFTYNGNFNDVSYLDSYANEIAWAIQKDIAKGTTTTTFSPNDNVSRQDMCTFLVRFSDAIGIDLPTINDPVIFADNKEIYDSAAVNVRKLQQAGVINGKLNNKFDPQGTTTKAEFATMIERFVLLIVDEQNEDS